MRPLFTIHAGEYVVGEHIEQQYPSLHVWIPSKDTGVDLLATDKSNTRTVSLQVKLSRDYKSPKASSAFDRDFRAGGWLTLAHNKIELSPADYWVIVVVSYERAEDPQFIVIPPSELLKRLVAINGKRKNYHVYPWIMKSGIALNGRGLRKKDRAALASGELQLGDRDLTKFLDNWKPLVQLCS